MDCLDFLLAMNFLARIVYDKKLKLIFELCDDDDDGCMTSEDILSML
jgi:Ca2+-binding EF-hand superfamily protein